MSEQAKDYDYELPPDRVAQHPPAERGDSRLLHLPRRDGPTRHRRFQDLPEFLGAGDLLVLNDTAVVPARLLGRWPSGGKVSILVLRATPDGRAEILMKSGRRPSAGDEIRVEGGKGEAIPLSLSEPLGSGRWLAGLPAGLSLADLLARRGRAPLPPYIRRSEAAESEDPFAARDLDRYQTVYAANPGAIAAPTAGLHFTKAMLARLESSGVEVARLTLHVGEGTFRPVSAETIEEHRLSAEAYTIPASTREAVARALEERRRVIAVGTTTCRALETGGDAGWTDLFIRPPYEFRVVSGLVTNFHLPRSTLLMLVAALAGRERVLAAYAEAVREGYRFYSYGDAMLVL